MRWIVAAVLAVTLVGPPGTSGSGGQAAAGLQVSPACGGVRLTVHPGLPAYMGTVPLGRATDVPRGPFTVQLPLYPGARPLTSRIGQPIPEFEENPYLQTVVAEYRSSSDLDTVQSWYAHAMSRCGWKSDGTGWTNGNVLSQSIAFFSGQHRLLRAYVSFGATASDPTVIAYAVEWITYPLRPKSSYLHGPFAQVRIAYVMDRTGNIYDAKPNQVAHQVATIRDRANIRRLVTAMNSLTDPYVERFGGAPMKVAPPPLTTHLTFVRADGGTAHAWIAVPGGPVVVNGSRPLADGGERQEVRVSPVVQDLLPQIFALQQGDLAGWTVAKVIASREEGAWRAWEDSRATGLYFFRGSWRPLGRSNGWFQHLILRRGSITADVTILTSLLSPANNDKAAQGLNERMMRANQYVAHRTLPLNDGMEVALGALTASGPGGGLGGNDENVAYLQDGRAFVELHADEAFSGTGTPPDVVRAIARVLGTRGPVF
jgi:hypothetical protein